MITCYTITSNVLLARCLKVTAKFGEDGLLTSIILKPFSTDGLLLKKGKHTKRQQYLRSPDKRGFIATDKHSIPAHPKYKLLDHSGR